MGKLFLNKKTNSETQITIDKQNDRIEKIYDCINNQSGLINNSINFPMSMSILGNLRTNSYLNNENIADKAITPNKSNNIGSSGMSFKIDDILNLKNVSNITQKLNESYKDEDKTLEKDLKINEKIHGNLNNKLALTNTNVTCDNRVNDERHTALSSSSSSSSSFCSPVPSTSKVFQNQMNIENFMSDFPHNLANANEFFFNNVNKFSLPMVANNPLNPFFALTQSQLQSNYHTFFENNQTTQFANDYSLLINRLTNRQPPPALHTSYLNEQMQKKNESCSNSSNQIKVDVSKNDETTNKLNLVNELSKQINALDEKTKKEKEKSHIDKERIINKKYKKKLHNYMRKKEKNDECSGCAGNCPDLACSISSVLPLDSQLPMCLRGSTDEQLNLASLFNTLIHHKKCRRTRTVFTDMQLIGLEKRFENQKYLSTPDRIQLAESLGLSQLQVKTWYQNRRMKWKKKVLKEGCQDPPTKPKGRPKKNSIPSLSEIIAAAEANGVNNKSTGSSSESIFSSSVLKNSLSDSSIDSIDENDDDDDDDEQDYSSTEIDTDNYTDEESYENETSGVRKMKYTNYQSEIFNIKHQSSTINNKSENDNKI